jgi:hypothetical protein
MRAREEMRMETLKPSPRFKSRFVRRGARRFVDAVTGIRYPTATDLRVAQHERERERATAASRASTVAYVSEQGQRAFAQREIDAAIRRRNEK